MFKAKIRSVLIVFLFTLLLTPASFAGNTERKAESKTEIKWVIDKSSIGKLFQKLDLNDDEAESRKIYFYDTGKLKLYKKGIILRSRKVKDDDDDSTVKIRPLDSEKVDKKWFDEDGFKCEVDRIGTKSTDSCSFTVKQKTGEIEEVADGEREIKKLFSDKQEEFLDEYGSVDVKFKTLRILGPIQAKVWKIKVKTFPDKKITVEDWKIDEKTRVVELSTRVSEDEYSETKKEIEKSLKSMDIQCSESEDSKTRTALLRLSKSK